MTIEIAGRTHLGEARKDRPVDHQLKVIAHRDTVVVVVLPAPNFGQRVRGGLFSGQKIKNNRREDESSGHGVGMCGRADTRNFSRWVAVYASAHIQSGGHACLVEHGEKVKHAASKSFRRK